MAGSASIQDVVLQCIDTVLFTLERKGKPSSVHSHENMLAALVKLGESADALGDNGTTDTWSLTMKRCYALQDKWEGKLEVVEPKQSPATVKAAWCQCGSRQEWGPCMGNGTCRCGIKKHHYHCLRCGSVIQVG